MSTHTRGRLPGRRQDNDTNQTQQESGRGVDGVDCPFPNKPLCHRRPFNPRTQDSLHLRDLEKMTITKQQRGSLLSQDRQVNDTRETRGSNYRRKDTHRRSSGEDQVARAIRAKQLMIQQTLLRVEEKLRQKIRSVEASGEVKTEGRRGRGRPEQDKAQTNTGPSIRERQHEDFRQLQRRQDQQHKDKMKSPQARRETEVIERPHNFTVVKQKGSGEKNKLRWENMNEHTGRKGEKIDHSTWGEARLRTQDRKGEGKEREHTKTSSGWTEEKKYRQRTYEDTQRQTADGLVQENHRGEQSKISRESPPLPVLSPPSSKPQGDEREVESSVSSSKLLPCEHCSRTFASERLEKHVQICKNRKPSRQVFSSYAHRLKGSANGEYMKTHSRSRTPEVRMKNNTRQTKSKTENVQQQSRLPAGNSTQKRCK